MDPRRVVLGVGVEFETGEGVVEAKAVAEGPFGLDFVKPEVAVEIHAGADGGEDRAAVARVPSDLEIREIVAVFLLEELEFLAVLDLGFPAAAKDELDFGLQFPASQYVLLAV